MGEHEPDAEYVESGVYSLRVDVVAECFRRERCLLRRRGVFGVAQIDVGVYGSVGRCDGAGG